jgi:hypothetical protein
VPERLFRVVKCLVRAQRGSESGTDAQDRWTIGVGPLWSVLSPRERGVFRRCDSRGGCCEWRYGRILVHGQGLRKYWGESHQWLDRRIRVRERLHGDFRTSTCESRIGEGGGDPLSEILGFELAFWEPICGTFPSLDPERGGDPGDTFWRRLQLYSGC